MTRFASVALILVAWCGSASAADLKLDPDPAVDNTAAVQAALDAVPAWGSLELPAGRYRVDGPVYLSRRQVGIIGDVAGTTIYGKTGRPKLVVGIDPAWGLAGWAPLSGYGLDASLVPDPASAFGVNLATAAAMLPATTAEHGPPADIMGTPSFWRGVRKLTVATIVVPTAAPLPGVMSKSVYTSAQHAILVRGNEVHWRISTTAGDRVWKVVTPVKVGTPLKLAFVLDLDTGAVEFYRDGAPLKIAVTPAGWGPGLNLVEEGPYEPFFGDAGRGDAAPSMVLAAFRMTQGVDRPTPESNDLWYAGGGWTANDFFRLVPQAAPRPYLPAVCRTSLANHDAMGLLVPAGYGVDTAHTGWDNTVERLRVESILGYGDGVLLGSVINFRADRLRFYGGAHGLNQVASASSYPVVVERTHVVRASHAAVRVGYAAATLRDTRIEWVGRHALVFLTGGTVEGIFCGEGGDTSSLVRVWGQADGCKLILRDAVFDYEQFKAERFVHMSQGFTWGTSTPYLGLTNVVCTTTAKVPILLDGVSRYAPPWKHGVVRLENAGVGISGLPSLVEMPGEAWDVQTVGPPPPGVPPAVAPPPVVTPPGPAPATPE